MTLLHTQIDDLVNLTLQKSDVAKIEDLASSLTDYVGFTSLMNANKVGSMGGDYAEFQLLTSSIDNFQWVGLFEEDTSSAKDVVTMGRADWVNGTYNWMYDVKEKVFNRGSAEILDTLMAREKATQIGAVEVMEDCIWGKPASSSDTKRMFGIQYAIVWETSQPGGNTTALPTGFSNVYNIVPSTLNKWANYTITHDNWAGAVDTTPASGTSGSPIETLRKAMDFTKFRPPVPMPDRGPVNRGLYTNYYNKTKLEQYARLRNENIGMNVLFGHDGVMLGGVPVVWVPKLDSTPAGSNPFYGIDWSTMEWDFQEGRDFVRSGPFPKANAHDTRLVHIDVTGQLICRNRRKQFVSAASSPEFT